MSQQDSTDQPGAETGDNEVQMENADVGNVAPQPDKTTTTTESTKMLGNSLSLPIARVKRIIKQDDDITACSTSAVYAIASATVWKYVFLDI